VAQLRLVQMAKLMKQRLFVGAMATLVCISAARAQTAIAHSSINLPKPVYLPEWRAQGLTGKGIVLVTVDRKTGVVVGARMLKSTGSKLLDGSALEALSRWHFKPGSKPQVIIPIEFKMGSNP
jgi:TonB family protein